MKLKPLLLNSIIPTIAFSLSINTTNNTTNNLFDEFANELKNNSKELEDIYELYYKQIEVQEYRNKQINAPKIGILDSFYVDPRLFLNKNTKATLHFIIPPKKNQDEYKIQDSNIFLKNNKSMLDKNLERETKNLGSALHATMAANILSGNAGISKNSSIYSGIWELSAKDLREKLEIFRKNDVNIINMSYGYNSIVVKALDNFIKETFSTKAKKTYQKIESFEMDQQSFSELLSLFENHKWINEFFSFVNSNFDDSFPKKQIIKMFFGLVSCLYDSYNNKPTNFIKFFYPFFDSEGDGPEFWMEYLGKIINKINGFDFELENYVHFFNSLFLYFEYRIQKHIMNNYDNEKKYHMQYGEKYKYYQIYGEEKSTYNEIAAVIDEYARNYNMKINISAGNEEFELFIFRHIKNYNKKLKSFYKYVNNPIDFEMNYYGLDETNVNSASSRNAIFIGSTRRTQKDESSIFSVQGAETKDDFPFFSMPGELNMTLDNSGLEDDLTNKQIEIIKKWKHNMLFNLVFTNLSGTSFSAPMFSGFLALAESINPKIKKIPLPLLKELLVLSTKRTIPFYSFDFTNLINDAEANVLHKNNFYAILGAGVPKMTQFLNLLKSEEPLDINIKLNLNIDEVPYFNLGYRKSIANYIKSGKFIFDEKTIDILIEQYLESNKDIDIPIINEWSKKSDGKDSRFLISWNSLTDLGDFYSIVGPSYFSPGDKINLCDRYNDYVNIFNLYAINKNNNISSRDRLSSEGINTTTEMIRFSSFPSQNKNIFIRIKNTDDEYLRREKAKLISKTLRNGIYFAHD